MYQHPVADFVTSSPPYRLWVDRFRALAGSWVRDVPPFRREPSSPAASRPDQERCETAAQRLPAIAEMGFDVVYSHTYPSHRPHLAQGPEQHHCGPAGRSGSPYGIGSADGGHDAIHPDLGTFADFDAFVARARELDLEVALDLALQGSPDHPWLEQHPEWFTVRPDGTIAYAENPPKKYQDIYPLNFDVDPEGLAKEVLRVVMVWIDHGVTLFRVDNPHTKPLWFWEWLIATVRRTQPRDHLLGRGFHPAPMLHTLAKVGFHQSYTYFTWRSTKDELRDYLTELSSPPGANYLRPNLFVNTHDILTDYLVQGGPPAFKIRAVLAALGSPSLGIYSGYELTENTPSGRAARNT